jgi:hypothetical protein
MFHIRQNKMSDNQNRSTKKDTKLSRDANRDNRPNQKDHWNIAIQFNCPICNEEFSRYPAISRYDNATLVCGACEGQEALAVCCFAIHS